MARTASDIVSKFAPNAKDAYVKAFAAGNQLLSDAGIDTPIRLTHFMTQVMHETGALTILIENGRYSAKNLGDMWDQKVWRKYFKDRDECAAMGKLCAQDDGASLFSLVYGGRMGNGLVTTGDGWTYRGRGILQTTGRWSYARYGKKWGVDFEGNPDLLLEEAHLLKPAVSEWRDKDCNGHADRNDIVKVTEAINGGRVGLDGRKAWFAKIQPFAMGTPTAVKSIEWRVQEKLLALGFAPGKPDGDVGKLTRGAIVAHRAKHGLGTSAAITPDLLKSLGIQ